MPSDAWRPRGVTITRAVDQLSSVEAGTFSVYRFSDGSGGVHVVRTPGDDVLQPKRAVDLRYVPDDESRVMERGRLVRKLVKAGACLGLGVVAAAAEISLLSLEFWPG